MPERTLTIARALTRMKTIQAQLAHISGEIGKYSAVNDKKRHPLGVKVDLKENHNVARIEVSSQFQQYMDLTQEFVTLKDAVDKANLVTPIIIGDKTMTINQALIYERSIKGYMSSLINSYNSSVAKVEKEVDQYNQSLTGVEDADTRKALMAQVLYLVPPDKIKEINSFLVEFMTTLNGTLNEVNATTVISIP